MEEAYLNKLYSFLNKVVPVTKDDWHELTIRLHYKEFEKYELITRTGETENYLFFLVDGLIRIFHMKNGIEYTLRFNFPISAFNSYASFITRTPSLINVEALSQIKVFRISFNEMQSLYENAPNADRIGRRLIELLYLERELKELNIHTLTAEDMYCELVKKNSELTRSIPQKHLASYLGITPESLSRIKRKLKS